MHPHLQSTVSGRLKQNDGIWENWQIFDGDTAITSGEKTERFTRKI